MHAHPPGPGLPLHAPSVMSKTFFKRSSGGSCGEFSFEKNVDCIEYLLGGSSPVNFDSQLRAVAHTMRKVRRELLHLSDRVRRRLVVQHRVVSLHNVVAAALLWMLVRSRLDILLDLVEDP